MNTIPWYQSAIVRQQIVQLLTAALLLFGVSTDAFPVDQLVGGIFAGVAALTAVWTIVTRVIKPAPPITQASAEKADKLKQSGYVRPLMLAVLLATAVIAVPTLQGCASLGLVAPQTLDERLAYAYDQHTAALQTITSTTNLRLINSRDAVSLLALADQSRQLLDAARGALMGGDVSSAEGRLVLAISVLRELRTYMETRSKTQGGAT